MKRFSQLAAPYIVWAVIMLLLPMLLIVLYAFTDTGNEILTFRFTLDNFIKFFTDPDFLLVLWRSIKIAFKTTVICVLLGYPIAYFIAFSSDKVRNILILAITLPTWINMLVRTYAWIGLLSDGGIFQQIFGIFGLGDTELLYTEGAVLIGMVYNFIPFMILQINTSLSKMDRSLADASHDLGADGIQTFLRVTLPLSLPGVVSGISLVFLPAVLIFHTEAPGRRTVLPYRKCDRKSVHNRGRVELRLLHIPDHGPDHDGHHVSDTEARRLFQRRQEGA